MKPRATSDIEVVIKVRVEKMNFADFMINIDEIADKINETAETVSIVAVNVPQRVVLYRGYSYKDNAENDE